MSPVTSSVCFPASYVTPTADCLATSLPSSRNTSSDFSEPLLDFALSGWVDTSALFITPPAGPLSASVGAEKTFDELTPEEIAHIAFQIEADVLSHAAHTASSDEDAALGPIRHRQSSINREHPYLDASVSGYMVAEPFPCFSHDHAVCDEHPVLPMPMSAGYAHDFASLMSLLSPSFELPAAAVAAPASTDVAPFAPVESETHRLGQYVCEWEGCTSSPFSTLASLSAHLLHRHVPRRRSQYPCLWSGCTRGGASRPFPKRHKLVAHLRSHTHERPFACNVCGRAFAREDSRDAHQKVHGDERLGPWGCSCQGGRVWRSWRGVRRHQATGTCTGVVQLATGLPVAADTKKMLAMQRDLADDEDEEDDEVDMDD